MPVKKLVSIKSNKITYKVSAYTKLNVNGKWKTADKINCGDTIILQNNKNIIVSDVEIINLHCF